MTTLSPTLSLTKCLCGTNKHESPGSQHKWRTGHHILLCNVCVASHRGPKKDHKENVNVIKFIDVYNTKFWKAHLKEVLGVHWNTQVAVNLAVTGMSLVEVVNCISRLWSKNKDDSKHNVTTRQRCMYMVFQISSKGWSSHMNLI